MGIENDTSEVNKRLYAGEEALAVAEKYGDRLEGVVLLSSTPNPDTDEKRENRRREIALVKSGKKDMLARVAPEALLKFMGISPETLDQAE